jgi:hypothetical protein
LHDAAGETGVAQRVPDRADLLDARTTSLVALTRDPVRANTVIARFWNGPSRCYGAHATVRETPQVISVTVVVGVLPEAAGQPCPAVAELQELSVGLASPVGDRSLRRSGDGRD